jgi:hypothetical protein
MSWAYIIVGMLPRGPGHWGFDVAISWRCPHMVLLWHGGLPCCCPPPPPNLPPTTRVAVRHLRHTAAVAGFCIGNGLIRVGRDQSGKLAVAEQQLEAELGRGKAGAKPSARLVQLEATVDALKKVCARACCSAHAVARTMARTIAKAIVCLGPGAT